MCSTASLGPSLVLLFQRKHRNSISVANLTV
jgi:hypothetical protein